MSYLTFGSTSFRTAEIFCLTLSLCVAGCSRKDLSPPPINSTPRDKIEMALVMDGKSDVSNYRVNLQVEYGNMSKGCSNIHSFEGGWVEYPHGYVSIDRKIDSIEIYRDYYRSRDECSWRLLGLGIYVYDEGGRLAVGGLPANYLKTGYSVKLHCNFSDKWSGSCLPGEAGHVRTDVTVDISIH